MSFYYGFHAVSSLIKTQAHAIRCIHLQKHRDDARVQSLIDKAHAANIPTKFLSKEALQQLVGNHCHQGIIADIHPSALNPTQFTSLQEILVFTSPPFFFLILDAIQDPHNLGACLRTALAAGVQAVIIPKNQSAGLTATVRKVACGAADKLPLIRVTNLVNCLKTLKEKDIWIYGTTEKGDCSLFDIQAKESIAWIMGNEGSGLRKQTLKNCDYLVKIPTHHAQSSLNVSVATGLCLFETYRQRQSKS